MTSFRKTGRGFTLLEVIVAAAATAVMAATALAAVGAAAGNMDRLRRTMAATAQSESAAQRAVDLVQMGEPIPDDPAVEILLLPGSAALVRVHGTDGRIRERRVWLPIQTE